MLMSPDSSMNSTKMLSPVIMANINSQPTTTSTMHQSVIRLRCKTPPTYNYQVPEVGEIKSIYQTSSQGYLSVAPPSTQHHQQVNLD